MDEVPDPESWLDRWRDKVREVGTRIALVRGLDGQHADAWIGAFEEQVRAGQMPPLKTPCMPLIGISGVSRREALRYFVSGCGETPPLLVLERIVERLGGEHRRLDEAEVIARLQARLFRDTEWQKWLASPAPNKHLRRLARWVAADIAQKDRVDPWADVPDVAIQPTRPIEQKVRSRAQRALLSAFKELPPADAQLLHLMWFHELNELEVRWMVEREKSIHHQLKRAFGQLKATIKRIWRAPSDNAGLVSSGTSPPAQAERRQNASRALRAMLPTSNPPSPPPRWQGLTTTDGNAGTPKRRPKRAQFEPDGEAFGAAERVHLCDDEIAAIALGWLFACHWSAAEDPNERAPRAARLAHVLAMGRGTDDPGKLFRISDLDRVHHEWHTLRDSIFRWLVEGLDISAKVAGEWLCTPASTHEEKT